MKCCPVYSERPNITTTIPHDFFMTGTQSDSAGVFTQRQTKVVVSPSVSSGGTAQAVNIGLNVGRRYSLYSDSVSTVQVDALKGLNLIRAF